HAIVQLPELGTLAFRIPLMRCRPKGKDAFLRARFFLVTTCTADGCIETMLLQGLTQGLGLHDLGIQRTSMAEGIDAFRNSIAMRVNDEFHAIRWNGVVTKGDHFPELPRRVDMQNREGRSCGVKGLPCKVDQNG